MDFLRDEKSLSFAALFLSGDEKAERATYVSSPPPLWLDGGDMRELRLKRAGVYCLWFLVFSKKGGSAYITVNGREIRGSYREEENGEICGSAICSIREQALPCALGITPDEGAECGVLLVMRCEI